MPKIPSEFIRELEERCRLEDIVPAYLTLKRRGKNLVGLCPFHSEKSPSFNVYPGNNSYYCFGCGKGGGVINFVMEAERLDFVEAVRWLAQRAGLQVPENGQDDTMAKLRVRILEINREAGRFFYQTLMSPEGRAGLDYFRARGLDSRTIRHFGLGYAPDSGFGLVNHLRQKGYTKEELTQSDMARVSQKGNLYDRYRSRVMFPIFDLRGNVTAFGGRVLTDEKPKYINTADTPVYHKSSGLFAMNFAKNTDSRQLILAEGYMDVIALHRAGFQNAGQKAAERAIPILKDTGLRVRVVTVPGGKDPDEFMRNYGEEGPARFRQLVEQSGTDVEYRLDRLRAQYDISTEDGRLRYLSEAAEQVLSKLHSPMEQDIYAGKLAGETGVDRQRILETVDRLSKRERRQEEKKQIRAQMDLPQAAVSRNPDFQKRTRAALAEEGIIDFLFRHQDKAEVLQKLVPPEKFVTALNRRVYAAILGKTIHGPVTLDSLSGVLTAGEVGELSGILARRAEAPSTGRDVREYVDIILQEGTCGGAEWVKAASDGDVMAYLQSLREKKS